MSRVYVSVKFRPGDKRAYTYHWDDDEVTFAPGDFVEVYGFAPGKLVNVQVQSISTESPSFNTKAIQKKVTDEELLESLANLWAANAEAQKDGEV